MSYNKSILTLFTILFIVSPVFAESYITQLTYGEYNDWRPRWSPDGNTIVFYSNRASGKNYFLDIYTVPSNGGNVTRVSYSNQDEMLPSWSRDSSEIIYCMWQPRWQIYKIPVSGGEPEPVGDLDGYEEYAPSYSFDGNYITYAKRANNNWDIYTMTSSGDNATRLTTSIATDSYPTYSPDGQWILFSSDRAGNFDIYKMPACGGSPIPVVASKNDNLYSEWSPDGSTIAFSSNRTGNWDIFTIPADGGYITNITDSPCDDYYPTWSPDSEYLAFYANPTGTFHIYKTAANIKRTVNSSLGKIKAFYK